MTNLIFFSILTLLVVLPAQYIYAGGPRYDWDERYEEIPGATDCWVDGFDDGRDGPFVQSTNDECTDKGNQYYRGWLAGCVDAGNTRDDCEKFTDE